MVNLYRVKTGSTGAKGEPIYDVFGGPTAGDYISDPSDARLQGVDINSLPEGTAPAGFTSKFSQVQGQPQARGGSTLAEYYKSQGQALPSVQDRAGEFEKYGLGAGYAGTAEQNTKLLEALRTQGSKQSKYEQGFQEANKALGDSAMDVKDGSIVQEYAPKKRNDLASAFVQTDPFVSGLVQTWQDYINPANQRASLADTYQQMIKDSGIESIDTELIDMKNIIEGTEDDLRTEITKAGGFATESQIQALTNSRNKQLIKNYNTLVDTRNAKEKYLETAINLEQADRQSADQRFESMFNMGVQIQQLQQKMQDNARSQMQWLTENVGFDGLYDSTGGDPYYIDLVEQTLGLPSGGLLSSAEQAREAKALASEDRALDLEEQKLGMQLKGEQIKTEQAQREKIYSDIQKSNNPSGKPVSSATALQLADSSAALNMLGSLEKNITDNMDKFGPIAGFVTGFNKWDVVGQSVQASINATKQIVGKYLEGGVLRKEDEDKYGKILPKLTDTSDVALEKLKKVRELVNERISAQRAALESSGYNPALPPAENVIVGPDGNEYEVIN